MSWWMLGAQLFHQPQLVPLGDYTLSELQNRLYTVTTQDTKLYGYSEMHDSPVFTTHSDQLSATCI
jgi:hypothetical protein